jgi:thioester reductase-like protein
MSEPGVLLTGATGLVGRYLLRDLLLAGRRVVVLARDTPGASARQRVGELLALWAGQHQRPFPEPVVLAGDLTEATAGLSPVDVGWLGRQRLSVLHAAACVHFRTTPDGEPARTNLEGTRRLAGLCARAGIGDFHHISTAFVCGDRQGLVLEGAFDGSQSFHNSYERSKWQAEELLRHAGLRVTFYRPSVVVGDSRTGYTCSYHGVYRFLDLADRLAGPAGPARRLDLRLPFTGEEPRNLVPVDWVARAVVRIVTAPRLHGRAYHLTTDTPTPVRLIRDVGEQVLGIHGVRWAGPAGPADPTALEEAFAARLEDYWPYRHGDPAFASDNTRAALPDLPPPAVDAGMLARLMRFAVQDRFGRARKRAGPRRPDIRPAEYVEQFFPEAVRRSSLAEVPLEVAVGLEVTGPGGGRWTCRWAAGVMQGVSRGLQDDCEVVYRLAGPTFAAVVSGGAPMQEAFAGRKVEIRGDLEKGLKLAALFDLFVQEFPAGRPLLEGVDGAPLPA